MTYQQRAIRSKGHISVADKKVLGRMPSRENAGSGLLGRCADVRDAALIREAYAVGKQVGRGEAITTDGTNATVDRRGRGNDWSDDLVYSCPKCGKGNLCDVCHEHELPRGECDQCPPAANAERTP